MQDKGTSKFRFAPVGSVVRDGYWRRTYRVLAHVSRPDWRGDGVRVEWLDGPSAGRVIEHSTAFDHKLDRIVES